MAEGEREIFLLKGDNQPASSQQLKGLAGCGKQVCLAVKQAVPSRTWLLPRYMCIMQAYGEVRKRDRVMGRGGPESGA